MDPIIPGKQIGVLYRRCGRGKLTTGTEDNLAIAMLQRIPNEMINPIQVMKAIVYLAVWMQGSSAFRYLSMCRSGGLS